MESAPSDSLWLHESDGAMHGVRHMAVLAQAPTKEDFNECLTLLMKTHTIAVANGGVKRNKDFLEEVARFVYKWTDDEPVMRSRR